MSDSNKEIVGRFEEEFKNKENLGIVDELMADNFVHHAPIPDIPPGKEGLKQVGGFIFSLFGDIRVKVAHVIGEGDLVATRAEATGTRKSDNEAVSWTENHFYQVEDGKITEWWGEGGPPLE